MARSVWSLCTVAMYWRGAGGIGDITLFSNTLRFFRQHSTIPMSNPILMGVFEVTFCDISTLNGRFGYFLLWSSMCSNWSHWAAGSFKSDWNVEQQPIYFWDPYPLRICPKKKLKSSLGKIWVFFEIFFGFLDFFEKYF